MSKKISIVLATYNSENIIKFFLNQHQLNKNKEIYIIDNGSSDNTTKIIEENYKYINLIKLKNNIGFGSAINIGLKKIKTKYALIINPDTLLSKTFFKDLSRSIIKYSNAGIIAPTILDDAKFKRPPQGEFIKPTLDKSLIKDQTTNFIHGSCFLINPSLFKNNEVFDTNIFLFFEDNDLSKRIINMNLDLIMLGNCFVYHRGEQSSKKTSKVVAIRNFHYGWSECYFIKKYSSKQFSLFFNFYILLIYFKRFIISCIFFNKKRSIPSLYRCKGIIAFIRGKRSKDIKDKI